jgi:glycosyltransferase involved in cell wall biosynthesis
LEEKYPKMGRDHKSNKTNRPLISVIMAVFNEDKKMLTLSIESILNQSYKNFEFIIIDDTGVKGTIFNLISTYAKKDKRIRLIKNPQNLGLTKSLNLGLKMCTGKYIARMDGDDISDFKRLKEQKNYLEENKEVYLIGSWVKIINNSNKIISEYRLPCKYKDIRKRIMLHSQFVHPSIMFRRELIDSIGYYNEAFRQSQDYEFLLRAVSKENCENLPKVLLFYRRQNNQITQRKWFKGKVIAMKIRLKSVTLGYYNLRDLFYLLISIPALFISPNLIYKMVTSNDYK